MKTNIFAKLVKRQDGGTFVKYIGRLIDREGKEYVVNIRFKDCNPPEVKNCPMEIEINKDMAQLSNKRYRNAVTDEEMISYTLWVGEWHKTGEYVDHSLDNFD